ncbi:hypothetical protein ACS4HS_002758 [Enterococcus hirae]
MKKINLITFFSLFVGILVNIEIFTRWLDFLFYNLTPFLIAGIIGLIISILEIDTSTNFINRLFAIISLIVNAIPICYFTFLYLAIG